MSAYVRGLLAAAASTVDGIEVKPHHLQTTEPGAGMVRLERIEYPNPFGGVCHWNVVIMLPQDYAAAEQFLDANIPAVKEAVGEQLVVTSVSPQRLEVEGLGILPCVFINGHREQE